MTFTNNSTLMPQRPSRGIISRVALLAAYSRAGPSAKADRFARRASQLAADSLTTFNVRSLKQTRQQVALARTLDSLCIDLCWLSETRTKDASTAIEGTAPTLSSRFRLRTSGAGKTRTPRLAIKKLVDPEVKRNYQNQLVECLPDGTVGYKRPLGKDIQSATQGWNVSLRTVSLLETRRQIPPGRHHNSTRRQVKLSVRADREAWWTRKAEEMEDAKNAGNVQELSLLEEVIRMVLEILNSILTHVLAENVNLTYSLLYKRDCLNSLRSHPAFQSVIQNLDTIISYFTKKMEQELGETPTSPSALLELIRKHSPHINRHCNLKKFPDLKFKYVEEESPDEFFIPYVWTIVLHQSGIAFQTEGLSLFSTEIPSDETRNHVDEDAGDRQEEVQRELQDHKHSSCTDDQPHEISEMTTFTDSTPTAV
ncbi:dymeclin [Clonorchis sinensis]|uniref:Dymeclin n=1 Tax=Clonorchis sinensis TaxID=79923 RepID=G7YCM4_CLOSI|nr:dymeclin [Clonorchis sinensis]